MFVITYNSDIYYFWAWIAAIFDKPEDLIVMKNKTITIILWGLTILWVVTSIINIYIPLSRAGEISHTITEEIYVAVTPENELKENIKADRNDDLVNSYEKYTRKAGHLIQYAIFGMIFSLCISRHTDNKYMIFGITLATGALFGVIDEFLQSFLEFRSGAFKDVLFDFSGVVIGCSIIFLIFMIISKRKKKNEK